MGEARLRRAPPTSRASSWSIAATDDTEVNIGVYDDAEQRAMLVNVVDVPPLCNFILPAIVRTGPLAIAISTAGASPALAKRMKREIAELFGEEYARLAVILNDARGWAKGTLPTYQDRKEFFEGIVNGDPDPVELLRAGQETAGAGADRGGQGARRGGAGLRRSAVRFAAGRRQLVPQAEPRPSSASRRSLAWATLSLAAKATFSSAMTTGRISASRSAPAGISVA